MKWYEVQPEIYKGKFVKRAGWPNNYFIEYGRCSGGNGRALMRKHGFEYDFYHASCRDLMAEDWIIINESWDHDVFDPGKNEMDLFRDYLETRKLELEDLLIRDKDDHEISFKRSIKLNVVNECIEYLNKRSTGKSGEILEAV